MVRDFCKTLLVLIIFLSFTFPAGNCSDQYGLILTIEPAEPEYNLWFGYKVDITGDKIVISEPKSTVGESNTAGSIRVFDLEGILLSTLHAEEPGNNFEYSRAFSCNDEIIVVGELYDTETMDWVGKVYVYSLDGILLFTLYPDEPKPWTGFGTQVGVSDDLIYIMERTGTNASREGVVEVYSTSGEYLRTIYSPDPKVLGHFGANIKTHGDRVFISQYGHLEAPMKLPGAVYVFDENGNLEFMLEPPEPESSGLFGVSVSVSDEYIVVNELWATVNEKIRAGKVHIYDSDGQYLRTIISSNPRTHGIFGQCVKILGDKVIIGEAGADVEPMQYEGKVHVYGVDGELVQTLTAPSPTPRGAFGWYIDAEGDMLVISEVWAEVEGSDDCGKVYLYKLGAPVEVQEPLEEITNEVEEAEIEPSRGIPGFPLLSILVALVVYYFIRERV